MPIKWLWFNLGLREKFWILVLTSFFIWLSNFLIIYLEIQGINQATMHLENCEDLYNTVLEIRRYEKNFLLYRERADLNETLNRAVRLKVWLLRTALTAFSCSCPVLDMEETFPSPEYCLHPPFLKISGLNRIM